MQSAVNPSYIEKHTIKRTLQESTLSHTGSVVSVVLGSGAVEAVAQCLEMAGSSNLHCTAVCTDGHSTGGYRCEQIPLL